MAANFPNGKQYYVTPNTYRETPPVFTQPYYNYLPQQQQFNPHQRPQHLNQTFSNINENKYFYDPNTRQYFYTDARLNTNFIHNINPHHQFQRAQNNFRSNVTSSGVYTNPNMHNIRNQQFNHLNRNENLNESVETKPSVIITEVSDDEDENEFKLKAKSDKSNYVDAISLNEEDVENENKS